MRSRRLGSVACDNVKLSNTQELEVTLERILVGREDEDVSRIQTKWTCMTVGQLYFFHIIIALTASFLLALLVRFRELRDVVGNINAVSQDLDQVSLNCMTG
jgi:hypothetical protein